MYCDKLTTLPLVPPLPVCSLSTNRAPYHRERDRMRVKRTNPTIMILCFSGFCFKMYNLREPVGSLSRHGNVSLRFHVGRSLRQLHWETGILVGSHKRYKDCHENSDGGPSYLLAKNIGRRLANVRGGDSMGNSRATVHAQFNVGLYDVDDDKWTRCNFQP